MKIKRNAKKCKVQAQNMTELLFACVTTMVVPNVNFANPGSLANMTGLASLTLYG